MNGYPVLAEMELVVLHACASSAIGAATGRQLRDRSRGVVEGQTRRARARASCDDPVADGVIRTIVDQMRLVGLLPKGPM